MSDSFWDLNFRKSKKILDEVKELAILLEKSPQYADDIVARNELIRSVDSAIDVVSRKVQALQMSDITELSATDKQEVLDALTAIKESIVLIKMQIGKF